MKTTHALLVTGMAAQQAAATWDFFSNFNSPSYNNNECSDKQKGGFDWSDLKDGDKDFTYGEFDFTGGWSCSSSLGKRDIHTKRTFGSKRIVNRVSKDRPASFGCDKLKSGFSITDIDVSVEFDTDLELHYMMPDGAKCKQYSSCSQGGTTLTNTQCGGAKSVDVYLGSHYKGDKSECEIGFHHIGFDCNPDTGYKPPSPPEMPSSSTLVESQSVSTTSPAESTASSCDGGDCNTQPPATSTSPAPCEGDSCKPESTSEASTSPKISYSTAPPFTNSSMPADISPPTNETPQMPPASSETTTLAFPPSSESSTVTPQPEASTGVPPPPMQESSGMSSACGGGYGESCEESTVASLPSSTGAPMPVTSNASPQPSSPSYSPASPPEVLPRCMNTWLQIQTECKDNTDKGCYCVNPEFTKSVIDCVSAWCGTDEETKEALQYLIGICAEYVPENPKIIEDCPTYIPLNPAPTTPTGGETGGVTEGASTTVTMGETPGPETPCTTITYGSMSLTVPQVHFTTQTNVAGTNPTEPVGLVPGTAPPQTPAATTAAPYPIPSTMGTKTAPAGTGTGAVTGTGAFRPSSPAEFTGAASPSKVMPKHTLLGVALAFFAL